MLPLDAQGCSRSVNEFDLEGESDVEIRDLFCQSIGSKFVVMQNYKPLGLIFSLSNLVSANCAQDGWQQT